MTDQNLSSKLEESIQYAKATEHIIKNDLELLLKENLKYSEAIFSDIKKIKRQMIWATIFNWLWIVIIIAPIILALIFLPTMLNGLNAIVGGGQGIQDLLNQLK